MILYLLVAVFVVGGAVNTPKPYHWVALLACALVYAVLTVAYEIREASRRASVAGVSTGRREAS